MMKKEEYGKRNENKFLSFQTEVKTFNNIDIDNDKETDDILTKLGNLSPTSDDKSFDSPIIFNRNKTFYNGYNTESKNLFYESFIMNNKTCRNFLDTNYELRNKVNKTNKVLKREVRPKSLISIKSQANFRNLKLSNFHNELEKIRNCEDIPEIVRNNSNNNFKIHYRRLESINEKKEVDKINSNDIDIIKNKIENINNLIKENKYIDKNLKRKDIKKFLKNYLLKNNENNLNKNSYESINDFLDYIIEILNSIENNIKKINNNKVGNEKIILKLKNEILEKEKEFGKLINKLNLEKINIEKTSKSKSTEILKLRKENKELNNKLSNSEKHISKLENNIVMLEDKFNKLIIEKTSKTINSCTSIRSTFTLNGFPKLEPPSLDASFMTLKLPFNEQVKNNNVKINDKYNSSKKLNLQLIDLLKEINRIIIHYDTNLNKEFGANKNLQNAAKNLNNLMDINGLSEDKQINMFVNEYMRNIDIVFKKIEEYLKDVNKSKYSLRHASFRIIPKKEKNVSKNKDKNNNKNNNVANITKNIKNSTTSIIPTRKRTKTICNPKIKDSI